MQRAHCLCLCQTQVPHLGVLQRRNRSCSQGQPLVVRSYTEQHSQQATSSTDEQHQSAQMTHPLQSTQEERDRKPSKHRILDKAEEELSDYCSALPGQDADDCWDAYNYFEEKKEEASQGCSLEEAKGLTGPQCQRLERFEDFVRQMVGEGHVDNFVTTLRTLSHAEKRKLAKELESHDEGAEAFTSFDTELHQAADAALDEDDSDVRKEKLAHLFRTMDRDGNGKLDAGEFRDAMRKLGDELSGRSVEIIFEAMDIHGWISLDQFVAIVESEQVRAHTPESKLLRRLAKESSWWTRELPRGLSTMS